MPYFFAFLYRGKCASKTQSVKAYKLYGSLNGRAPDL